MNLVQTDIIDAVDARGRAVAELDGSDVVKAAQEFARKWEGGIIRRIHDGEGPTMTRDELSVIATHAWRSQDGISFKRRYLDGSRAVYPEGDRFYGVQRTNLAQRVSDALDKYAHDAWNNGMKRISDETAKLDAELAVTDAKRYEAGLAEVRQLDAKNQLKAAIEAMSDPVAKATMREKYPELFDRDALSKMAQERSHAKHGGR